MALIRAVKVSDAPALVALFTQLDNETPFMAMGEQNNAAELSESLGLFIDSPSQALYVIEQDAHNLLGFAIGITGYVSGDSNTVSLVMGIEQANIGRGLGRQLLLHVETWAQLHQLQQLELTVMVSNQNAIEFYKHNGFKQITSKSQGLIDDLTEHELYMLKRLN